MSPGTAVRLAEVRADFRVASRDVVAALVEIDKAGQLTPELEAEARIELKSAQRRWGRWAGKVPEDRLARVIAKETGGLRALAEELRHQAESSGRQAGTGRDRTDQGSTQAVEGSEPEARSTGDAFGDPHHRGEEKRDSKPTPVDDASPDACPGGAALEPEAKPLIGTAGKTHAEETEPEPTVPSQETATDPAVELPSQERRELVLAIALALDGTLQQRRRKLQEALERGLLLHGPVPSVPTLSRWLERAGEEGGYEGRRISQELLPRVMDDDWSDERFRGRLLLMGASLAAGAARAVNIGAASTAFLDRVIPLLCQVRVDLFRDPDELWELADELVRRLHQLIELMPRHDVRALPAVPGLDVRFDPELTPTRRSKEGLYPSGEGFGQLARGTVVLPFGAPIPGDSDREKRAAIRAMIAKPVFRNEISAKEQARVWREKMDRARADGQATLEGYPLRLYRRWFGLSDRSVRDWVKRIRDSREDADAEQEPPKREEDVLLHHYPENRKGARVITPDLDADVRKLYLTPERLTGAAVASLIKPEHNVSEATVRRVIARIPMADILAGRLAPQPMVRLFHRTLLRRAVAPMMVIVADATQLNPTLLIDPRQAPKPILVRIPARVEEISEAGYVTYRRIDRVYVTLVIDACTDMWLALRVWDKPVDGRAVLLTLYDVFVRYGRFDTFYSDNGGEFRYGELRSALNSAGIREVHSIPYQPEGRGRIEQAMHTLKEYLVAHIKDGRRYGAPEVPTEALLLVREIEQRLQQGMEELINEQPCRGIPVSRREHFETLGGGQGFRTDGAGDFALRLLERRDDARVEKDGIYANGMRYWMPELDLIPERAHVLVFSDRGRPRVVHLGVRQPDGTLRYLFPVEQYGINNPAPSIGEQWRMVEGARCRLSAKAVIASEGTAGTRTRNLSSAPSQENLLTSGRASDDEQQDEAGTTTAASNDGSIGGGTAAEETPAEQPEDDSGRWSASLRAHRQLPLPY